jgi:small conductance mechanosensitive channel
VSISILITGFLSSLGVLHLEKTVTSILAGAGIFGLAIGFAFQDLVTNFISGLLITFYKPFEVGNSIKTKEFSGKVVSITMRSTTMDTDTGERVLIPNKDVVQNPIINNSATGYKRIHLSVRTKATLSIDEVREKILALLKEKFPQRYESRVDIDVWRIQGDLIHYRVSFWQRALPGINNTAYVESQILDGLREYFKAEDLYVRV